MKPRLIIFIVLLNIMVLAAGFFYVSWYLGEKVSKGPQDTVKVDLTPWKNKVAAPPSALEPKVVYKTNKFNWSQIESADYRQYIANLRSVGCPEATIKDLILTDVMRLYAGLRGKASVNGREFKYWETDEKRKLRQHQLEERDKKLAQIDKDLPAVLRELLGISYERELDKYFIDTSEDERKLAFLSDDKRDQILALRDQIEGQRERVLSESKDGQLSGSQIERLKKIDADRDAALTAALTPGEKDIYELSTSETAERLRKELIGFNPTEAEFKEIFRRQQALDQSYAYANTNDDTVRAAKAADQAKLDQEINNLLDPLRVPDYQRARNEDYRNLYVLAERFDLPPTTSQWLLDMRQVAEEQKNKLLATPDLSPDKRVEALKIIQAETEKAARQTLGEKGFSEYNQVTGNWIQGLGN